MAMDYLKDLGGRVWSYFSGILQTPHDTLVYEHDTTEPIWKDLEIILREEIGSPTQQFQPTQTFLDDLNCDSTDMIELVMACEQRFDISLEPQIVGDIETVGDLLTAIRVQQRYETLDR